jgi:hypothetical protein
MDRTSTASDGRNEFTADELRELQRQLACLAAEARDYPLEYAVGSMDLLFESRDDIEILLDSLAAHEA